MLTIYKDKRGQESLGISCNGHCPQKREKKLQWKSNEMDVLTADNRFVLLSFYGQPIIYKQLSNHFQQWLFVKREVQHCRHYKAIQNGFKR